ncbi:MAG: hypothetical protein ABJB11_04255 [Ferruginibacter sp.]
MKHFRNLLKSTFYIIGIFAIILFSSCRSYYKIVSVPSTNNVAKAASLDSLKNMGREFIIRNGNSAFYASSLSINSNESSMECVLDKLAAENRLYVSRGINGKKWFTGIKSSDYSVLNEVHLYTEPDNSMSMGNNKIYLDKIQKIEIIEKDKGRTTTSHLLGALAITATLLAVIVTLVALSNPFTF